MLKKLIKQDRMQNNETLANTIVSMEPGAGPERATPLKLGYDFQTGFNFKINFKIFNFKKIFGWRC